MRALRVHRNETTSRGRAVLKCAVSGMTRTEARALRVTVIYAVARECMCAHVSSSANGNGMSPTIGGICVSELRMVGAARRIDRSRMAAINTGHDRTIGWPLRLSGCLTRRAFVATSVAARICGDNDSRWNKSNDMNSSTFENIRG